MTTGQNILIVDDEESIRWVFAQALEEKPFTVHTAASAEEALEKIKEHSYLLVFTDIFMPGMSGMELLDQIKDQQPQSHVVVMTAQDTMNNTILAMRKGAYDYISKPFDFGEIYGLIDKVVASSQVVPPEEPVVADGTDFSVDDIVGKSRSMQDIFKTNRKVLTKTARSRAIFWRPVPYLISMKKCDNAVWTSTCQSLVEYDGFNLLADS
ncbi:MAG: sigma-54-dependent Fis family transcriptional regulator [Nitrospinae bacterium]|nr:sigma-54-dependent Fis family transcriptional regulator [Nitrospinota bacterium]